MGIRKKSWYFNTFCHSRNSYGGDGEASQTVLAPSGSVMFKWSRREALSADAVEEGLLSPAGNANADGFSCLLFLKPLANLIPLSLFGFPVHWVPSFTLPV